MSKAEKAIGIQVWDERDIKPITPEHVSELQAEPDGLAAQVAEQQREIERLTAEQRAIDAAIPNEPRYGIDTLDRITAVVANMQAAYARSEAWEEMERDRDAAKAHREEMRQCWARDRKKLTKVEAKLRAVEALRDEMLTEAAALEGPAKHYLDDPFPVRCCYAAQLRKDASKLTAILTPQEGENVHVLLVAPKK